MGFFGATIGIVYLAIVIFMISLAVLHQVIFLEQPDLRIYHRIDLTGLLFEMRDDHQQLITATLVDIDQSFRIRDCFFLSQLFDLLIHRCLWWCIFVSKKYKIY